MHDRFQSFQSRSATEGFNVKQSFNILKYWSGQSKLRLISKLFYLLFAISFWTFLLLLEKFLLHFTHVHYWNFLSFNLRLHILKILFAKQYSRNPLFRGVKQVLYFIRASNFWAEAESSERFWGFQLQMFLNVRKHNQKHTCK